MLQAAGVCVPVGGGPGASGEVRGAERGCVRTEIRVPNAQPHAATRAAPHALLLPGERRLRNSSGEADAVPDFSVLARIGGPPAGVGENSALLSRNRPGPADSDQERTSAGGRDAGGAS